MPYSKGVRLNIGSLNLMKPVVNLRVPNYRDIRDTEL